MFDSIVVIIGLVGGIASIVSFLIDKAGYGGKFVHAIYVFFVALLASFFVYESSETKAKNQALTQEIQLITSIEYEAAQILKNSNRSNDGSKRGFIFGVFQGSCRLSC